MTEVRCPGCEEDVYPVKHLSQGGAKKLSCPRCQCALPATILDTAQAPAAEVVALRTPPSKASIGSAAHVIAVAAAHLDPEAQIRARLEYIDARLAELEPLREEQAKLRRMLDAAAPPSSRDDLVPIRIPASAVRVAG